MRLLVLIFLLIGALQTAQSFAALMPQGSSDCHTLGEGRQAQPHSCCPDAAFHASCCLDAGSLPLSLADSNGNSLWCGRTGYPAPPKSGRFRSRSESPLIRPPIP
jgi:hypothetical protein